MIGFRSDSLIGQQHKPITSPALTTKSAVLGSAKAQGMDHNDAISVHSDTGVMEPSTDTEKACWENLPSWSSSAPAAPSVGDSVPAVPAEEKLSRKEKQKIKRRKQLDAMPIGEMHRKEKEDEELLEEVRREHER